MTIKLEKGILSTGYRSYNSEGKLISWIDHRCKYCGRFIKGKQKTTCRKCSDKYMKELRKKYYDGKGRPYLFRKERKLLKKIRDE